MMMVRKILKLWGFGDMEDERNSGVEEISTKSGKIDKWERFGTNSEGV